MTTVTIEVTAEDIERGEGVDPFACPVALAMKRALGHGVSVVTTHWRHDDGREWVYRALPEEVADFISAFDLLTTTPDGRFQPRHSLEPFTFEVDPNSEEGSERPV